MPIRTILATEDVDPSPKENARVPGPVPGGVRRRAISNLHPRIRVDLQHQPVERVQLRACPTCWGVHAETVPEHTRYSWTSL
eukprot:2982992-Rhodomonas_salina.1